MIDYKKLYETHFDISWDSQKFEIHHIDGDRENNEIHNLVLLPVGLHRALHRCGFDIERYRCQMLNMGQSDQDPDELIRMLNVLESCRRWGRLKAMEYRRISGGKITIVTEEAEIW